MNREILLIGIGEFGCAAAEMYARNMAQGDSVRVVAVDTDARTAEQVSSARFISMAQPDRIADALDAIDPELLKSWFPCDRENDCVEYFEMLSMQEGANQWRMKAMLSFYRYLSQPKNVKMLDELLTETAEALQAKEGAVAELCVAASLAGGTGSALLLPLVLYLRRRLRELGVAEVRAQAVLALPDITEEVMTPEQRIKARANAYAALRELNAVQWAAADPGLPVHFRIGCPEDPVFGVLWDGGEPSCRVPEGAPFRRITLIRRIPGVHSVYMHTEYVADSLRLLLADPCAEVSPDAVFTLFSRSKTVFRGDQLLEYFSLQLLHDIVDEKEMDTYRKVVQAKSQGKKAARLWPDGVIRETADEIARAAEAAVSVQDWQTLMPQQYYGFICSEARNEFQTDGAQRIQQLVDAEKNVEAFLPVGALHQWGLRRQVKKYAADLQDYYTEGAAQVDAGDAFLTRFEENGDLSLTNYVLTENGTVLSPVRTLIRLCALYRALEKDLACREWQKDKRKKLTPHEIPAWLSEADASIKGDCTYHLNGTHRFRNVLDGQMKHLGCKPADVALFRYDLSSVFLKMQSIFAAERLEKVRVFLARWICRYDQLLAELHEIFPELKHTAEMVCSSCSGRSGGVYYVGTTPEEKQTLYRNFRAHLKEVPYRASPVCRIDNQLGRVFFALAREDTDAGARISAALQTIQTEVRQSLAEDDFCRNLLKQNILQVMLAQDGKNGTDTVENVMYRAFSGGIVPMPVVLPETPQVFQWRQSIRHRVMVQMPVGTQEVLRVLPGMRGQDPIGVMEELLNEAGQHRGEVCFTPEMPENELCVIRKTEGVRLPMIDTVCETEENPIYYLAYLQSLRMQEKYYTDLWNPYLVCSLKDGDLPPVRFTKRFPGAASPAGAESLCEKEAADLC